MNCNECEAKRSKDIPYIVYESECARHDRSIKRLVIVIILCVCLLFASNLAWLYAWNQYDYVDESVEISTDGGGHANYIGEDGNINNYGEGAGTANNENP